MVSFMVAAKVAEDNGSATEECNGFIPRHVLFCSESDYGTHRAISGFTCRYFSDTKQRRGSLVGIVEITVLRTTVKESTRYQQQNKM